MSEQKKTDGEELSDLLYGLQITVKIMEGLSKEHDAGSRDQEDFEARWQVNTQLYLRNLSKVKPLVETFITKGFDKFRSVGVTGPTGPTGPAS
jgi:hypothetical protein